MAEVSHTVLCNPSAVVLVIDTSVATEGWAYCSRFPGCMGEVVTDVISLHIVGLSVPFVELLLASLIHATVATRCLAPTAY